MSRIYPLIKGFKRSDGTTTSRTVPYIIIGETDDALAEQEVYAFAPNYVLALNGMPLPKNQMDSEQLGDDVYVVTITYGTNQDTEKKKPIVCLDTGGTTQRITQSLGTVNSYAAGDETPPNFGGAIGVTRDGIEGVELPFASQKWNEKHYLPKSIVNTDWENAVTDLGQHTNNAPFRGRAVDQVKFSNVTTNETGDDLVECTFYFEAAPHVDNITIGNISGISKKAWDYLWVFYTDDRSGNWLVKKPRFVYVEQVFYQGDFSVLAIPQGILS